MKTSFLNPTVLKKDITRFAPIWGSYTILLLLSFFGLADNSPARVADCVQELLSISAILNLIYAGVCGAFLFMDLFQSRLCNALHAFPLRRECWLATHILSGFLFSFIPNLMVSLLGSLLLQEYTYMAFIWLAVSTLQFLFFFGTAVLSAMCAGNLIGMAAAYGIIHFITLLIYAVADLLYVPLLYGVAINEDIFFRFFPISQLVKFNYIDFSTDYINNVLHFEFFGFLGEDWWYLGLCATAGAVSILLAWLVYRCRQLETAGDLISLRQLTPVFLLICTVGAGAFLYLLFKAFGNESYVFLVIGMVIGYFAGRMLLNRTVKVFTKKAFLTLGVLTVILAGSMYLTWLDPLGITRYVPDTEQIANAAVVGADKSYYYAESFGKGDESYCYEITDPEELVHLQDFHRQLIQYRPGDSDGTLCTVNILYTLENGRTVKRYYQVGRDSSLGVRAGKYFSDMRYIFEVNDPAILYEVFESADIDIYASENSQTITLKDPQQLTGLLDAIAADCEAGTMAQNWAYHEDQSKDGKEGIDCYIGFFFDYLAVENADHHFRANLQIWSDCTNTMAYIEEMLALHPHEE